MKIDVKQSTCYIFLNAEANFVEKVLDIRFVLMSCDIDLIKSHKNAGALLAELHFPRPN